MTPGFLKSQQASIAIRTLLSTIIFAIFALLLWRAIHRPLWNDEVMAMVNYPVMGVVELFAPLPYYSQAAPPLFNLICSAIVAMAPPVARTLLALLIIGGLAGLLWMTFRRWWAPLIVIAYAVAIPTLTTYATEFKYYGLEALGVGIVTAWFMARRSAEPLRPRDIATLTGALLCGISTIAVSALALALAAVLSWHRRRRIGVGELALGLGFGVAMIAYYLTIRFGTSIQVHNYPDSYGGGGLTGIRRFAQALDSVLTTRGILLAVAAGAIGLGGGGRSRRVVLLAACAFPAFLALAAAGLYPVSAPRHLIWAHGLILFLISNAVATVAGSKDLWPTPLRGATAGLMLLLALSMIPPMIRYLNNPRVVVFDANDHLVAWLAAQPASHIGMWQGTQATVEHYRTIEPEIAKHHYFGAANQGSAEVPDAWLTEAFLAQPYDEIAAQVESVRKAKGGHASRVIYRLLGDYRGVARSLLAEAPKGRSFYIVASHIELNNPTPKDQPRRDGLLRAIAEADCHYAPVLVVHNGFILRVACPTSVGQAIG